MVHAAMTDAAELRWHNVRRVPIAISGLPFLTENEGQWWRFPQTACAKIPEYVWETAKCSSGVRVRLRTNATKVFLRGDLGEVMTHPNTSRYGAAAFDVYVDQQYLMSHVPEKSGEFEAQLINTAEAHWRELTIYLPLFAQASVREIGVNTGAEIDAPEAFVRPGPVVFYGTSITHGGCAARSGLSYPAQLCRSLNLDFINFGMNGCGRGEEEVGRILARVPNPSAYVLDYAQNNQSTESLAANYEPFIRILRAKHPTVPILCTTPIYWSPELPGTARGSLHAAMRQVIRGVVEHLRGEGDENVHVVEGFTLLGPDQGDGLIDGLHPNTLGFSYMARGLAPALRSALKLP